MKCQQSIHLKRVLLVTPLDVSIPLSAFVLPLSIFVKFVDLVRTTQIVATD